MSDLSLILLGAGESNRFNKKVKKQWLRIGDIPLWLYVALRFKSIYKFDKIIITANRYLDYMRNFGDEFIIIEGGDTRQESLNRALKAVSSEFVLVSDVARACVKSELIAEIINHKEFGDCIVPYIGVSDTVVYQNSTIERDEIKLIQTPQLSKTKILKKALLTKDIFTDDSSAIKAVGGEIFYLKGSKDANKITYFEDLKKLNCLKSPSKSQFVGFGFDTHPFIEDKEMFLGGIKIDYSKGFKAHSDGDVLIHSIIDALLGGVGGGDIGEIFPDTDNRYKNIDSSLLLRDVVTFIYDVGYEIVNIDCTVVAEEPKLKKYKSLIKNRLSEILQIPPYLINIKATTSEKLGFIGRCEGVSVYSIANLKFFDWESDESINS